MQGVVTIFPSALADGDTVAAAFGAVVGGTLGSALTTPYSAAVVTLLYFDLRVRKEGLDLRLIAEGADVERDPGAPLPPPVVAGECTPEGRAGFSDWRPPSPDAPAQPSGWLPPRAADAGERSGSPPDGGA